MQDAFCAAIQSERPVLRPAAFLAGTLSRLARRGARANARRVRREDVYVREGATDAPATDELIERVDVFRTVLDAIRELPTAQRRAVTLRYIDGLTPAEIASREDVRASTVRANLARGMDTLRSQLHPEGASRARRALAAIPGILGFGHPRAPRTPLANPAGATLAPGAGGWWIMTQTKWIGSAVLGALALGGLWLAGAEDDVPAPEVADTALRDVSPSRTASLSGPSEGKTSRVPARVPQATTVRAPSASTPAPTLVPMKGMVVDVRTSEPVPRLPLTLRDSRGAVMLTETNAAGEFDCDEELGAAGSVTVKTRDRERPHYVDEVTRGESVVGHAPFDEPIPVAVGPTFQLRFEPNPMFEASGVDLEDLRCDFLRLGAPHASHSRFQTVVRSGELPWVRFAAGVADLDPRQDWSIELVDQEGLWAWRGRVARTFGVEPEPLSVHLESRGALRFVERASELDPSPAGRPTTVVAVRALDRQGPSGDDDRPLRVFLGTHSSSGEASGRVGALSPGRYAWSIEGTTIAGEALVPEGEVTTIELPEPEPGFDTHVVIDVTACPDANPTEWLVIVGRSGEGDEPAVGFMARASQEGSGEWRVNLPGLDTARWEVSVSPPQEVRLDRMSVEVGPGDPPPRITVRPAPDAVEVTLSVVDADTGGPIEAAEAGYISGFIASGDLTRESEGDPATAMVPPDWRLQFIARAPGYQLTTLDVGLPEDGGAFKIRLKRGWRGRAVVVNVMTHEGVGGIAVVADGKEVGRTGADGSVWIEGNARPNTLTLELEDTGVTLIQSPMDSPTGTADCPVFGWAFVVMPDGG